MINDTIDIMDAKIVNIGIDFSVVGAVEKSNLTFYRLVLCIRKTFYRTSGNW